MKIANKYTKVILAEFRSPGMCDLCRAPLASREVHHHRSQTPELSIRINLVSVGPHWSVVCRCHDLCHASKIPKNHVLEIIAARERCKDEDITEVMDWMRHLVKPTKSQLMKGLEGLSKSARLLAERELDEVQFLGFRSGS